MLSRLVLGAVSCVVLLAAVYASTRTAEPVAPPPIPEMKFNDVKEVAPGVFFRYSSISATDKTVPFGGSNNIWVVFEDYVLVYDANFPKEAGDVLEAKIDLGDDAPVSARIRVIRMDAVSGAWRQTCTAAYDEILSSDRERIQDFVQARMTGGNLSLHEF